MLRGRRLCSRRSLARLHALARRTLNYSPPPRGSVPARRAHWRVDRRRIPLAQEPAGAPVSGGAWERACRLVRDYQFAEPSIIRAIYPADHALLGRDMLLEGRFAGLRFDMGVRVTAVIDETRGRGDAETRVWGWAYGTLEGHLEQGELTYEVVKQVHTGAVEFRISGYSRCAPLANPVIRLGFALFGRWTQQRFYRASGRRLRRLLQGELDGAPPVRPETVPGSGGVIIAPTLTGKAEAAPSGNRRPGL
ncbi:hypothetical protein SLNWT_2962 [Streptomyces albus]|uniref:DUF1990 domain-containing protein n=1 Tax=Streptomyces albus (strain ATCC 21838 / DSM 41398 / FERM P-419 / JCM 4703 / NBRC 107858) TaxID=1081613 RepID=A0A0B5ELR4_STRA4|nr:hypothetical protein SLNWT_2962 [Streptomyces albus]AOU77650.1 hypothetical protein SLNHY_2959 [Streptomyces albus]AYN33416.1 DUF1990 domain-containing protein [Streptomyces albus]